MSRSELASLSREELLSMAQDLEIEGVNNTTPFDELVSAIVRAENDDDEEELRNKPISSEVFVAVYMEVYLEDGSMEDVAQALFDKKIDQRLRKGNEIYTKFLSHNKGAEQKVSKMNESALNSAADEIGLEFPIGATVEQKRKLLLEDMLLPKLSGARKRVNYVSAAAAIRAAKMKKKG